MNRRGFPIHFRPGFSSYLSGTTLEDQVRVIEFGFFLQSTSEKSVRQQRSTYDSRVRPTIEGAIKSFFSNNPQDALIVTYESLDGRHKARKNLFERWYNESGSSIEMFNAITTMDDTLFDHSLFVLRSNKHREDLISAFYLFIKIIQSTKR